jgi:hypothetical protein
MFGLIPTWKVLLGAVLSIVPFAGGLYTYDKSKMRGWKKPAAAAGVYGALQLGVSYINLQLLTPSLGDIADAAANFPASSTGSLYLPRDGALPRALPMNRYGSGIGLIDATLKMARAG